MLLMSNLAQWQLCAGDVEAARRLLPDLCEERAPASVRPPSTESGPPSLCWASIEVCPASGSLVAGSHPATRRASRPSRRSEWTVAEVFTSDGSVQSQGEGAMAMPRKNVEAAAAAIERNAVVELGAEARGSRIT